MSISEDTVQRTKDGFAFWCGVGGVAAMMLFVIANFALGDFEPPPPSSSGSEVAEFFAESGSKIEWAAGLRFVIFLLLAFLLYGVARHVQGKDRVAGAFSRLALMGTVWLLAVGTVANTFESILVFESAGLGSQPELARLANLAMNGLFQASIVAHIVIIGCLSLAALRTKKLPPLLIGLGGFQVITGLLGAVGLAATFSMGWFFYVTFGVSFVAFALWYLWAGIVLIVESRRVSSVEPFLALIP